MTLPTREEAYSLWTRYDNIEMGSSPAAIIIAAYANSTLATREEFVNNIDIKAANNRGGEMECYPCPNCITKIIAAAIGRQ